MSAGSQPMNEEKSTESKNPYIEAQRSSPEKSSEQPVSHPLLKRRKKRNPLVDAATAPAPIDVEEAVAGIKRELPPVDAAKSPPRKPDEAPLEVDDPEASDEGEELVDVPNDPEPTLEEELLRAVGLENLQ